MNKTNKNIPTIDNVRVSCLRQKGINNILEWLDNHNNIYIGRKMRIYVKRDTLKAQISNKKYTIIDNDKTKSTVLVIIKQSIFHNPFNKKLIKKYGEWQGIYKKYLYNNKELETLIEKKDYKKLPKINLLEKLKLLQGKNLGCWCSPKSCHGDVLIDAFSKCI